MAPREHIARPIECMKSVAKRSTQNAHYDAFERVACRDAERVAIDPIVVR